MQRILLIDGHNLLFKMFYGMPFPFFNDSNTNITATVGFIGSVFKMLKYTNANECLIVFDGENNKDIRPDQNYKANRQTDYGNLPDEENPFSQLRYIKAVLNELKIKWVETDRIECDDYIAIVAQKYTGEVIISSTDTDFFQLVNDNIKILKYRGKNSILIDENYIKNKFEIFPCQFALYKSFIGDTADNIKGISNVGKKTALKILDSITTSTKNKFYDMYYENINLINKNLDLIKLPNKSVNRDEFILGDYSIDITKFKNFKNLNIVNKITNKL